MIPIFLQSMKGSPRRARAIAEIKRVFGPTVEPIISEGWDKGQDPFKYLYPHKDEFRNSASELGHLACACGHITSIIRFLNAPFHRYGLFLEDDVEFLTDRVAILNILKSVNDLHGFDWIQFVKIKDCGIITEVGPFRNVHRASVPSWCSACYALSKEGAAKLLNFCIPLEDHFDMILRNKAKEVVAFQALPGLAKECGDKSLINL